MARLAATPTGLLSSTDVCPRNGAQRDRSLLLCLQEMVIVAAVNACTTILPRQATKTVARDVTGDRADHWIVLTTGCLACRQSATQV